MPLFMDVHRNLEGASLADIEQAHLRDEEAQDRHGVKYHRFFHNPAQGTVFCLAEGPSADACRAVHIEANGMVPDEIIEVEPIVVDGFLGGGSTKGSGVALTSSGSTDTALRTLMFTDIVDSTALTEALGDEGGLRLVEQHDNIVREALRDHAGREIKHTGDGVLASFVSPRAGVACAVAIQRAVRAYRDTQAALPLSVRIGMNVGEPVAAHGDIFGLAVNLCRRICDEASGGEILVSQVLQDLIVGKGFVSAARQPVTVKGISTRVALHQVAWDTLEAH